MRPVSKHKTKRNNEAIAQREVPLRISSKYNQPMASMFVNLFLHDEAGVEPKKRVP